MNEDLLEETTAPSNGEVFAKAFVVGVIAAAVLPLTFVAKDYLAKKRVERLHKKTSKMNPIL